MKLTLTQFVTLDGVYQGPGSPDEDTTDGFTRGGWMVPHMDQAFIERAADWLTRADWAPSTILAGDIVEQVAELKARPGGELQLHGSARLSQTLLAAGLIDEIRLVITPTVLGQGRRLFAPEGPAVGMRVIENSTTPGGLTILVLEKTADAEFDTYEGV